MKRVFGSLVLLAIGLTSGYQAKSVTPAAHAEVEQSISVEAYPADEICGATELVSAGKHNCKCVRTKGVCTCKPVCRCKN